MNKQSNHSVLIAPLFLLLSVATTVQAQTVYVSDELKIHLRTGPSLENKITRSLKSGVSLEVIQENSNGYTEVKTAAGKTGWVLKRQLMADPSARNRLNEVQERELHLAQQQQEIETLRAQAIESEQSSQRMQESNARFQEELKKVKNIAADTLTINKKNTQLAAALAQSEEKQTSLQIENSRLKNNTEQAWFLRGAGVILLGMFLGLLIPKLRFKKKRRWGDTSNYS